MHTPRRIPGPATIFSGLLLLTVIVTGFAVPQAAPPARAQTGDVPDGPPFAWPFADPPGPNTWVYTQHYGNTPAAFNFGDIWYAAGQGLHFGVDLMAPCGTPVLAIADAIVRFVDATGFGAGPHNLILEHPGTGYTSLYGHLQEIPRLTQGQTVKRGDQVGLSGDPDGSCGSRPHLHLEIRSTDFQTAYNPVPFFEANWHMLTSIGPNSNAFQQDLDTPYRWMTLEDQPPVRFSSNILNRYQRPWPPKLEQRPPASPAPAYRLDPLADDVTVTRHAVARDQWNLNTWWDPHDAEAVYLVDAVPGQPAGVFRQPLDGSPRRYLYPAPPRLTSPDGSLEIARASDGTIRLTERATGATWTPNTFGVYPAIAPDNSKLLYEIVYGEFVPGTSTPGIDVRISDRDGSNMRSVATLANGYSQWLDSDRLLLIRRTEYAADSQLSVLDLRDDNPQPELLAEVTWLRGVQVAPGGDRIAFWLGFQDNPDDSGVYVLETRPGSRPRKLPFFGGYRWRDSQSLYTLSFDASSDVHALGVYDLTSRTHRTLTDPEQLPLRIANGEWSVAPDGTQIVYVDPTDYGLYRLTIQAE